MKSYPDEAHRDGMTLSEARAWIKECDEMGFAKDAFTIIRRPVGEWEALTCVDCNALLTTSGYCVMCGKYNE